MRKAIGLFVIFLLAVCSHGCAGGARRAESQELFCEYHRAISKGHPMRYVRDMLGEPHGEEAAGQRTVWRYKARDGAMSFTFDHNDRVIGRSVQPSPR